MKQLSDECAIGNTQSIDLSTLESDNGAENLPTVPVALHMVAVGRAAELLRETVRRQVSDMQRHIGFTYLRFHGLFHDEMQVCRCDDDGELEFTWWLVDDVFDFLLGCGLRPCVELGFMPEALSSGTATCFEWKANVTPPENPKDWDQLVHAFATHCIGRYGIQEVSSWLFEVWNEPNLGGIFWTGGMQGYFDLFARTWQVLKSIDTRLKVGGPATSNFTSAGEAPWFPEFDRFCRQAAVVPDFFSCHPYPNTWALDTDGHQLQQYRPIASLRQDCAWLSEFLQSSCNPEAEMHLTEWNSSPSPRDLVHDTAFMGPFILESLVGLPAAIDSVCYWVVSDMFEENGIPPQLFHGGFGLYTVNTLRKTAWFAYFFLAKMRGEVVATGPGYLSVRSEHDGLRLLVWNHAHYTEAFASGDRSALSHKDRYGVFKSSADLLSDDKVFTVRLPSGWGTVHAVERIDPGHGSVFDQWVGLGCPETLSLQQEARLKASNYPTRTEVSCNSSGLLEIRVPAHGMALVYLSMQ